LQPAKGYRNTTTIVFVLTDGRASEGYTAVSAAAANLRARAGVVIACIGLAPTGFAPGYNLTELRSISSRNDLVYQMTFSALAGFNGSDALSTALLGCASNAFEVQGCTPDYDRVCQACSSTCGAGSYRTGECRADHDYTCVSCNGTCPSGQFESSPCDGVRNRVCSACSTSSCLAGQFQIDCTPTADRSCQTCSTSCGLGRFQTGVCKRMCGGVVVVVVVMLCVWW
jgi:hypothetical protein